jgi:hypothetical protein
MEHVLQKSFSTREKDFVFTENTENFHLNEMYDAPIHCQHLKCSNMYIHAENVGESMF